MNFKKVAVIWLGGCLAVAGCKTRQTGSTMESASVAPNVSMAAINSDTNFQNFRKICLSPSLATPKALIEKTIRDNAKDCPTAASPVAVICIGMASNAQIDSLNSKFVAAIEDKCPNLNFVFVPPGTNKCTCRCNNWTMNGIACQNDDLSSFEMKKDLQVPAKR